LVYLTEGWWGDAAQILPAIARYSEFPPCINLKILLRDENEAVMNRHLTNGSKSIPKAIAFENATGQRAISLGTTAYRISGAGYGSQK